MDPFDDFEFKPLTEGLGFHKKAEKPNVSEAAARALRAELDHEPRSEARAELRSEPIAAKPAPKSESLSRSTPLSTETESDLLGRSTSLETSSSPSTSISDLIASLPPSLDFVDGETTKGSSFEKEESESRPQIFQPLAREEYKAPTLTPPTPAPAAGPTIGQVLPAQGLKAQHANATIPIPTIRPPGVATPPPPPASSAYRERLNESYARAFPHAGTKTEKRKTPPLATPVEGELIPVPGHFGAGILDGMVVSGMSTVLLVLILAITHINLWGLLSNAETDGSTQIHLVLLFLAVLQLYMLTSRSFFGATLGEWAFDMQLGTAADQKRAVYPLLVAWRTLFVTVTGLVILPIVSLIMKRDITAQVSRLQLYRRP